MKLLVVSLSFILLAKAYQFQDHKFRPDDVENSNSRIVGGLSSFAKWIPYQAGLYMVEGIYASRCGGSLIVPNLVLTAAHCLEGKSHGEVWFGSVTYRAGTKVDVTSDNFFIHPEYFKNGTLIENDIALILLPTPVTLSDTIQTIDLPSSANAAETFVEEWVVASGWGRITDSNLTVSDTLLYKVVRAISNTECDSLLPSDLIIQSSHLCLESSVCNGDSGGPAVTVSGSKPILIGAVSFGVNNGCESYPNVFARVTSYLDWIEVYVGLANNLL